MSIVKLEFLNGGIRSQVEESWKKICCADTITDLKDDVNEIYQDDDMASGVKCQIGHPKSGRISAAGETGKDLDDGLSIKKV